MKQVVHHILVNYDPPQKDVRTSEDTIVFFSSSTGGRLDENKQLITDSRHQTDIPGVYQACPLHLKPGEKAVVLGLCVVYSQNDYADLVVFNVDPLFDREEGDEPERTNIFVHTRIAIPGNWCGEISSEDAAVVYKPNLYNLGFQAFQYIGSEGHIMSARSTIIGYNGMSDEYQAFGIADPFTVFVLTNRDKFKDMKSDDVKMIEQRYFFKRAFVEQVRNIFRLAIFPLIKYTTKDHIRFKFKDSIQPSSNSIYNVPIILFRLQLTFIVVRQEIPIYNIQKTTIKL